MRAKSARTTSLVNSIKFLGVYRFEYESVYKGKNFNKIGKSQIKKILTPTLAPRSLRDHSAFKPIS